MDRCYWIWRISSPVSTQKERRSHRYLLYTTSNSASTSSSFGRSTKTSHGTSKDALEITSPERDYRWRIISAKSVVNGMLQRHETEVTQGSHSVDSNKRSDKIDGLRTKTRTDANSTPIRTPPRYVSSYPTNVSRPTPTRHVSHLTSTCRVLHFIAGI